MPRSFLARLLSLLPKSLLSSWVGRAVHAPLPPPVARRAVALFAHWYRINLGEAELPLAHYPTIGALFSRRLKPGVRPLGPGPVHPADALITASGPIDQHTLLQGKGHTYTLEELVHHPQVASHFVQGSFLTYYLCPTDYHRVHAPVDGAVTWSCHIPGAFWPVNAWGVRQVPKLFCINERVVTLLQTPQGPIAVVMIAALHVGQITLAYDPSITTTTRGPRRPITETVYTPPKPLRKGAELGGLSHGEYRDCPFCSWRAVYRGGPPPGSARAHGGVAAHARLTRRRSAWVEPAGRGQHCQWIKTDTPPGPEASEAVPWCP